MKKLFTILTVVAFSTTMTFAQQGTWALGVGSDLANTSWQDYELIPTIGYFVTDNILVGAGFSMGSSTEDEALTPNISNGVGGIGGSLEDQKAGTSNFDISPFMRYYINESLFASVGLAIGSATSTEEARFDDGSDTYNTDWEQSTSTFGMNFGVGYSLMWNDRIAIEPSLSLGFGSGGEEQKFTFDGNTNSVDSDAPSTFGIAAGLGINIRLGGE